MLDPTETVTLPFTAEVPPLPKFAAPAWAVPESVGRDGPNTSSRTWWMSWLPVPLYILLVGNRWVSEGIGTAGRSGRYQLFQRALALPHWALVTDPGGEYEFARADRALLVIIRLVLLLGLTLAAIWLHARSSARRSGLVLVMCTMVATVIAAMVAAGLGSVIKVTGDSGFSDFSFSVQIAATYGAILGLLFGLAAVQVARARVPAPDRTRRVLGQANLERIATTLAAAAVLLVLVSLMSDWIRAGDFSSAGTFTQVRRAFLDDFDGNKLTTPAWPYFAFGYIIQLLLMIAAFVAVRRRGRAVVVLFAVVACAWQFVAPAEFDNPGAGAYLGALGGLVLLLAWAIGRGARYNEPALVDAGSRVGPSPSSAVRGHAGRIAAIALAPLLLYSAAIGNQYIADRIARTRRFSVDKWSGPLLVPLWRVTGEPASVLIATWARLVLLLGVGFFLICRAIADGAGGVFWRSWAAIVASSVIAGAGAQLLFSAIRSPRVLALAIETSYGSMGRSVIFGAVFGLVVAAVASARGRPSTGGVAVSPGL